MKPSAMLLAISFVVVAGLVLLIGHKSVAFHFSSNQWPRHVLNAQHTKPCVLLGVSLLQEVLHLTVLEDDSGRIGSRRIWMSPRDGFLHIHDANLRKDRVAVFAYDPAIRRSDKIRTPPPMPSAVTPVTRIEVPLDPPAAR